MNILKSSLLGCLVIFTIGLYGQDTLITRDGEIIEIYGYRILTSSEEVSYKTKKGKLRYLYFDEVFSVQENNGKKTIIYEKDTLSGYFLSSEDMEQYLNGIIAARENFNTPFATILGLGIGVSSSFISQNAFWGPAFSVLYTGGASLPYPTQRRVYKKCPISAKDNNFSRGYRDKGKSIRTRNSILGSVVGYICGATIYVATKKG